MRQSGIGAAQILGHHGILNAEAADVDLVNHGIREGSLGLGIVTPVEAGINDNRFGNAGGAVFGVHLQRIAGRDLEREDGSLPVNLAGERLGVGVDEQLVEIETMTVFGVPGTVDAIPVELAGLDAIDKAVPYKRGSFAKGDTVDLFSVGIEETNVDAGRALREDGEVRSSFVSSSTKGVGLAGQQRAAHRAFDAKGRGVCCMKMLHSQIS